MGATTWVFGPVIDFLKARGYDDSNLKGAPYDWRMPPMYLEQRDQYFTTLCRTIEDTYRDNGDRPVVLLAHSMGNNMAHYFCNWVVNHGHKITQIPSASDRQDRDQADEADHPPAVRRLGAAVRRCEAEARALAGSAARQDGAGQAGRVPEAAGQTEFIGGGPRGPWAASDRRPEGAGAA